MHRTILLWFVLGAFAASPVLGQSFPLPFKKVETSGPGKIHSTGRHHKGIAQIGEIDQDGFWFANFTVGSGRELVMLIDTGSTDVYLNPGVYSPSKNAVDTGTNFTITFATTNPDGSGTETISGPIYEDIVTLDSTSLSVAKMPLGAVTVPQTPPTFPNDGLVGFAGLSSSALNATSWFQHLCDENQVKECRFGIAYKTDETGIQYFGYVAEETFEGPLSVGPVLPEDEWSTFGDIAFDGKVITKDQLLITDSGTTIIFGPLGGVQALFDAAGIESVLRPSTSPGTPTTLDGYFSCSNPPTLGFGIPSISNASEAASDPSSPVSHNSTIFNILPSQLIQNSTGDNCTASIHGTNEFGNAFWLVGQVFFQGKYIDHNHETETMGFALLEDP